MFKKSVPRIPRTDHDALVLTLPGVSATTTISIIEKTNKLANPTHPQTNPNGRGPFNVCNMIVVGDSPEMLAPIPIVFSMLAMNEAKLGMYGLKNGSIKLETKLLDTDAAIRNKGEKASLRALKLKKIRNKPSRYTQ